MEVFEKNLWFLFRPKNSFLLIFNISFLYYTKIFNLDDTKNENNEDHNKKWQNIPDHA